MYISSVQVNVQVVLVKYLGLCYDLSLTFDTRLFLKMSNIDICLFADNSNKICFHIFYVSCNYSQVFMSTQK